MTTPTFERFRWSFLDDESDSYREGLDKQALRELEGEERARAEDLLIARLPEYRAIVGLGVLRSRRAEPELKRLFEEERPSLNWNLIALGHALWLIEPDPRWLDAEIAALARAASKARRMEAAIVLRDFREPEASRALVEALDDDEPLVRHHAAKTLLVLHGQPFESEDPKHPMYRVMSDDRAERKVAKVEILAVIAGAPLAKT